MLKKFGQIVLTIALAATPVCLAPIQGHAQGDARQRAYEAGYQNGVNDREQNKSLNLKTDNWHGENREAYEKGYERGYRNVGERYNESLSMSERAGAPMGGDEERAYEAGYQNGVNDRAQNKSLNLKTGNWHGANLEAYQRGYENGYRHRH